jgi:hypothetical protein
MASGRPEENIFASPVLIAEKYLQLLPGWDKIT